MIVSNKCSKCKYVYELTWDDEGDKYYNDYDEQDEDDCDIDYDDVWARFCPFCGTYKDAGSEEYYD